MSKDEAIEILTKHRNCLRGYAQELTDLPSSDDVAAAIETLVLFISGKPI